MPKAKKSKPRIKKPKKHRGGCYFIETGTTPDYKNVLVLRRFISDRGKIIPKEYSGVISKKQRLLSVEIKKARFMSLLPYTDKHSL